MATSRLNRLPAAERGITIGDFLVPIRVGERLSTRARHLVLIVAGATLIALTANYSVPVPGSPVPITGQTFSVLLVGGALGFRRGLLATALYVVLGFFLPVYAQHDSGIATIATIHGGSIALGATGGYLVGFIVAGGLVGRLAELGWDRRLVGAVAAMAIGNVLIYVVGIPWLMAAAHLGLADALQAGLRPFLVGDAIKLLLAGGLFPVAWWVVHHRPGER
ncbi:MAG TPA: biotin transporter BioY [Candidatus Saccharimonadales bacterium]|nr:biotin transporter BioY [Candidatus Saccharimonadales bacterium]